MRRIFMISGGFPVPDGTIVYPFLNTKDSTSGLPWDLLDGFSLSAGVINPYISSKIHVMPQVTQVTFVLEGQIDIVMKDTESSEPYKLHLAGRQAVITRPGTYFQIVNDTDRPCLVLYIVSPAYVFDLYDGQVRYDDAVVLDEDWQDLEKINWLPSALNSGWVTAEARQAALDRLGRHTQGS